MAEYIERKKALNVCEMHYQHCLEMRDWHGDRVADDIKTDIETIPVADVVEVVRKPVNGYEEYYEVDQFGRVYSVDRVVSVKDNGRVYDKPLKGKQMKQSVHTKGYKTVSLTKDGKTKTVFVHRIVAEAFIPNTENLPMVNHKDEDKTNNFVENLEWCTNGYNLSYGNARKRQANSLKWKKHTEEHNAKISASLKKHYKNKGGNDFCSYGERKENEQA